MKSEAEKMKKRPASELRHQAISAAVSAFIPLGEP